MNKDLRQMIEEEEKHWRREYEADHQDSMVNKYVENRRDAGKRAFIESCICDRLKKILEETK